MSVWNSCNDRFPKDIFCWQSAPSSCIRLSSESFFLILFAERKSKKTFNQQKHVGFQSKFCQWLSCTIFFITATVVNFCFLKYFANAIFCLVSFLCVWISDVHQIVTWVMSEFVIWTFYILRRLQLNGTVFQIYCAFNSRRTTE